MIHEKHVESGARGLAAGIGVLLAFLTLGLVVVATSPASGAFGGTGGGKWSDLPRVVSSVDFNGNGVSDTNDILEGARLYVRTRPIYRSAYYRGGYPPAGEGVCTDVIWAAFKHAGYDLKTMVSNDIKANRAAYSWIKTRDSNIDFRRVPTLRKYFQRHGKTLGTKIVPGDRENLAQWQPGDIVTFKGPDHIAILSDKRNEDGVPYLLHNDGPWASEEDGFMRWYAHGITGHFRFPAK